MQNIKEQAVNAVTELLEVSKLKAGDILVIGCSSSEIMGSRIGTNSDIDAAEAVFSAIYPILCEKGIFIAAQCCEHLNRAIVIERSALPFADPVNVVPRKKAGGSFATVTYNSLKDPVVLEEIRADAGLDIGNTLIGMHLKKVAVPLRLKTKQIGEAPITAARTRPKFIGGERAAYNEDLT